MPIKNPAVRFQSPQWGDNSKESVQCEAYNGGKGFSPRNGEIILKVLNWDAELFKYRFSPRNGEIILKNCVRAERVLKYVSVPAMGR